MKRRRRIPLPRLAPLHHAFLVPNLSHQLPIAASRSPPHSTPTSSFLQRRHGHRNPLPLLCHRLRLPSCAHHSAHQRHDRNGRFVAADGTSNARPRRRMTTRNWRHMVPVVPNVQVSIDLGFVPSTVAISLGFITGMIDLVHLL